jgi:hypothetical protein
MAISQTEKLRDSGRLKKRERTSLTQAAVVPGKKVSSYTKELIANC